MSSSSRDRIASSQLQDRSQHRIERSRVRLVEAFSKLKRVNCFKLSKNGLFWKERKLEVNPKYVQYYTSGRTPVLKGQVELADIFEIAFPESEMAKKIRKNCICFIFRVDKCHLFNKGVEIPQKNHGIDPTKVGHIMWTFRFQEGDINFDVPKDLPPLKSPIVLNNRAQIQDSNLRNNQFSNLNQNNQMGNPGQRSDLNHDDEYEDLLLNDSSQQNQLKNLSGQAIINQDLFQDCIGKNMNWDTMYFRIWDKYYSKAKSSKQLTKQEEIQLATNIFSLLGMFREVAVNTVREVINELIYPERKRKFCELGKDHPMYQFKIKGEKIYEINGIFIRLSYIQQQYDNFGNVVYNDTNCKIISNEFKANNFLSNAIHNIIMDRKNFKLRIPLTCVVEYLGFKCLCTGAPKSYVPDTKKSTGVQGYSKIQRAPLDANKFSLIQGLNFEEKYTNLASVDDDMKILSQRIKLKPLIFEEEKKVFEVYLSYFCEVHRFQYDDDKFSEKQWDLEKKNYLFRTSTILPLHIDNESKKQVNIYKDRLREEFVERVDKPLSNSAFIASINSKNEVRGKFLFKQTSGFLKLEDTEVAEASSKLIKKALRQMIDDLDNLKLMAIGSENLKQIFHSFGVNMRHLGKAAVLSQLPHVRDVCFAEIIARSSKKILRANVATYILQKFRQGENFDEDDQATLEEFYGINQPTDQKSSIQKFSNDSFKDNKRQKQDQPESALQRELNRVPDGSKYPQWVIDEDNPEIFRSKRIIEQSEALKKEMVGKIFEYKIKNIMWDYLNLVFSNDEESYQFWENVLKPQVNKDFNFDIGKFPPKIAPGLLMHAVKYHWRINFNISDSYNLFMQQPFGKEPMKMVFCTNSKIYNLKNIPYYRIINQQKDCIKRKDYELALNYIQIKETVLKAAMDFEYTPPHPHELGQLKSEQAQLYLKLIKELTKDENIRQNNESFQIDFSQQTQKYLSKVEQFLKQSKFYIPNFHADIVKLSGVQHTFQLLKKNTKMKEIMANEQDQIKKILLYHLGTKHPLQSFTLCFQANQLLVRQRPYQIEEIQKEIEKLIKSDNFENKVQREKQYKLQDKLKNAKKGLIRCVDQFKQAINISKVILECYYSLGGFHIKIAEFYQDLSVVNVEMNELREALNYLEQAKRIMEFVDSNNTIGLAKILQQISLIYLDIGDYQRAFANSVSAYDKFRRLDDTYFKDWVYCQYISCASLINYEIPNIDTINSNHCGGLLDQSCLRETLTKNKFYILIFSAFKQKKCELQELQEITLFYNQTIIDLEIKMLDLEFKRMFFDIIYDENEADQKILSSEEERTHSEYRAFFVKLSQIENQEERLKYIDSFSKKNSIAISKLMRRQFYPGQKEMNPSLKFHSSKLSDPEKLQILKDFATGNHGQGDQAINKSSQHIQLKFMPNENDEKSIIQLNQIIKSIFEDMIKKMSHIRRMTSLNIGNYDSSLFDLIEKFLSSYEIIFFCF